MEEKIVKPVTSQSNVIPSIPAVPPSDGKTTITIKTVPTKTEPTEETKVVGDMTIPSDPYYTDPIFYEVANYFGLQQEDYAAAKYKLSDVVDYVIKEIKSNKPEDILTYLRKMEDTIQRPSWDEKRYTNVHKYVRLAAKKQSISQAMSAYERKGAFDYGK